jgi:hypothetical protein
LVLHQVEMKSMSCCKESFKSKLDSYHSDLRAASRRARLARSELLQPIVPTRDPLDPDLQTMASKSIKQSVVESLTGSKGISHTQHVPTKSAPLQRLFTMK